MNKKQLLDYESPTTELINLRIESGILILSGQDNTIENATIDNWGTL